MDDRTIMWGVVSKSISEALGSEFIIRDYTPVSGGCINEAYRVEAEQQVLFVKRHHEAMAPMFQAEFEALKELEFTQTIKVPMPICWGASEGFAWLVTSFWNWGLVTEMPRLN